MKEKKNFTLSISSCVSIIEQKDFKYQFVRFKLTRGAARVQFPADLISTPEGIFVNIKYFHF